MKQTPGGHVKCVHMDVSLNLREREHAALRVTALVESVHALGRFSEQTVIRP